MAPTVEVAWDTLRPWFQHVSCHRLLSSCGKLVIKSNAKKMKDNIIVSMGCIKTSKE